VAGLRLEVGGRPVAARVPAGGLPAVVEAAVPAAALGGAPGPVEVVLRPGRTARPCDLDPASGDRRTLGVAVSRVELLPA
jgi:hypothetical protein